MEMLKDGTIRGTPQEITEYQRIQAVKAQMKPMTPHPFDQMKYWRDMQESAKKQQYADCGGVRTPEWLQHPNVICMNGMLF